jgi:hypothetical protein
MWQERYEHAWTVVSAVADHELCIIQALLRSCLPACLSCCLSASASNQASDPCLNGVFDPSVVDGCTLLQCSGDGCCTKIILLLGQVVLVMPRLRLLMYRERLSADGQRSLQWGTVDAIC